jgi:Coenzyme PQQ synthesis protein D (PqqD)
MNEPITLASRISLGDDVVFRDLEGEMVLLDLRRGVYFSLDPLGTRIWHLLDEGRSLDEVVGSIVEEYDTTRQRFAADLLVFLASLREQGLVDVGVATAP